MHSLSVESSLSFLAQLHIGGYRRPFTVLWNDVLQLLVDMSSFVPLSLFRHSRSHRWSSFRADEEGLWSDHPTDGPRSLTLPQSRGICVFWWKDSRIQSTSSHSCPAVIILSWCSHHCCMIVWGHIEGISLCMRKLFLTIAFKSNHPMCVCVCVYSSLLEQKDDLRKRLSYTTHKLELLQNEFDSTRQYLETELRRAQEELDKFTDKLRRWVEWWKRSSTGSWLSKWTSTEYTVHRYKSFPTKVGANNEVALSQMSWWDEELHHQVMKWSEAFKQLVHFLSNSYLLLHPLFLSLNCRSA